MREISCEQIRDAVAEMCIEANCLIGGDVRRALEKAERNEDGPLGRQVLETLLANARVAEENMIPICQDTGLAVVFAEVGQEVHIGGGSLKDAINAGVAKGYEEGYLRKSVVADPLRRENTKNNTPAVIHCDIVPGDRLSLTVAPKGFGSENMSALVMLTPSQGREGVKKAIVETVRYNPHSIAET